MEGVFWPFDQVASRPSRTVAKEHKLCWDVVVAFCLGSEAL